MVLILGEINRIIDSEQFTIYNEGELLNIEVYDIENYYVVFVEKFEGDPRITMAENEHKKIAIKHAIQKYYLSN